LRFQRDKSAAQVYRVFHSLSKFRKRAPTGPAFSLPEQALTVLETRLEEFLRPAIEAAGFDLVRLKVTGSERKTLQVMAERPDHTMSAEDCARLSRLISPILDEKDPIPGSYRLEVSSPGIDRPLVRLKDYHDWQGYEAKIELNRMAENRRKFKGVIAGVDGDNVCIDIEGEEGTALIPFAWIAAGRLMLSDEIIRESLKAAKDALKEKTKEKTDDKRGDRP
jgi:ribosome maturation factor RimP